jgi:hypothetical protein
MADPPDDEDAAGDTPPWGTKSEPRRRPDEPMALMARSARETADTSARTLDRVSELRSDVVSHLHRQDTEIAVVRGQLEVLIDELKVARRERSAIQVATVQARIEVERTGEIAKIDETAARRKHSRDLAIKIIAVVGPIVAAIISALAVGGCP